MSSHEGSKTRIPPSQKPQEQDGTWLITTTPQRLSNVVPPVIAAMTAPPAMLEVMQTPSRLGSLPVSNATKRNGQTTPDVIVNKQHDLKMELLKHSAAHTKHA